jgi:hypothetical protein
MAASIKGDGDIAAPGDRGFIIGHGHLERAI